MSTTSDVPKSSAASQLFAGDSEMARRMRDVDWSKTAIGPPDSWSPTLRTMVPFLLANRFPCLLWWGPEYIQLYNDAYIPVLGKKHPHPGLGTPVRECWNEIWHILQPLIDTPFRGGAATWVEDLELEILRHGFMEETHFTVAYSPVPDPSVPGGIGGVLATVHEVTKQVIQERRVRMLQSLGEHMLGSRTADDAARAACRVFEDAPKDIPFAAIYLFDEAGSGAYLAATAGMTPGAPCAPERISNRAGEVWPVAEVASTLRPLLVSDIASRFASVPAGPWTDPPTQAMVLPIPSPPGEPTAGAIVFGVSARAMLDELYRGLLDLAAGQVASAISNTRSHEAERRRSESLAELDRAKTAFFSNVSHEFRTPLTLMLGHLEDVLSDGDEALEERVRERLGVAHRNSLRLLRLVNTLLDFARIEAGRARASIERADLARLTAELASNFNSTMERGGLAYRIHCPPLSRAVYVDHEMWEKIVLNLISNAFKFTLEGQVEVALSERENGVELIVRDSGCGIPQGELGRVFDRFHRVDGTRGRTFEGTGIGLALVNELARAHGGSVSVESTLGRGSTFRVFIPWGHDPAAAEPSVASGESGSRTRGAELFVEEARAWLPEQETARADQASGLVQKPDRPLPRVLVADDNADMRAYIARLLDGQFLVDAVADGERALSAVRERMPDLILTDVMMPGLDGFGLLRRLRDDARTASIPVILLSARAGEEARIEGHEAWADDYLVKPFSARELVARIASTLGLARARREAAEERARLIEGEREAQHLAEVQRQNIQTVCTHLPSPVVILDGPRHRIRFANAALLRLCGVSDEADVLDRDLFEVATELRDQAHWRQLLDQVHQTGMPYVGHEERIELDRDGTVQEVFFTYVCSPISGPRGDVDGIFVLALDVTAEVRARQEAQRLVTVAEDAHRVKDEFLAVLSHELRTPMSAMLGWIQILKRTGMRDPALVEKAVETLERNIGVQSQVVNDLLDVSRILAGKLQIESERLELGPIVLGSVESLRPSAEAKSITLRLEAHDQDLEVVGDNTRLHQIVGNIIGNAIKFTDGGGSVTVAFDRVEDQARLVVTDTGHGIASDFLPHLFERFRQADSSPVRRHGGLGLGLSIVKTLVECHGGTVHASSDGPGRGSRFEVRLPLAPARQRLVFTHGPLHPARTAAPGDRIDVLVVEDDSDSRAALELLLRAHDFQVRAVASVREALDACDRRRPDIVVSDIAMPVEDGYSFIRTVREQERNGKRPVLAVAMTGFAAREDHATALRSGFDEHIAKPIDPEMLIERIHALAASRTAR